MSREDPDYSWWQPLQPQAPAPSGPPVPAPEPDPPSISRDGIVVLVVAAVLLLIGGAVALRALTSDAGDETAGGVPPVTQVAPAVPGGPGGPVTPPTPSAPSSPAPGAPAVTDAIQPGIYAALPKDIEGGTEGTALEFEVRGDRPRVKYIAGFGMESPLCKPGATQPGAFTFLDDEPLRRTGNDDGTSVKTWFEAKRLSVSADAPGEVHGVLRYSFDGGDCRGSIRFTARRQATDERPMHDQILRAGGATP